MARSERLVLQVTPEMKERIERLAAERDVSVSALCANALGKFVRQEELEKDYHRRMIESLGGAMILR